MNDTVVLVGLGEIGAPLLSILKEQYTAMGVDTDPVDPPESCSVLHICIPFEIEDFVGECVRYVNRFQPGLVVIHSTVAIGTTRAVDERVPVPVVHSPVRGKHTRMREELIHYVKFIGASDAAAAQEAEEHFQAVGIKTKALSSPEATELSKLSETTYFGVLIAWAQQVERYCDAFGADYEEVVSIYDEIGFFPPVRYFPGAIGGHCVMPNIDILESLHPSELLQAVKSSNAAKIAREAANE